MKRFHVHISVSDLSDSIRLDTDGELLANVTDRELTDV
jgi:hypothetical protein